MPNWWDRDTLLSFFSLQAESAKQATYLRVVVQLNVKNVFKVVKMLQSGLTDKVILRNDISFFLVPPSKELIKSIQFKFFIPSKYRTESKADTVKTNIPNIPIYFIPSVSEYMLYHRAFYIEEWNKS